MFLGTPILLLLWKVKMLAVRKFSEILKWKGKTHESVLDYIFALPKERFQTQTCTVWNTQGKFTVIKKIPIDCSTSITLLKSLQCFGEVLISPVLFYILQQFRSCVLQSGIKQ